MPTGYTSDIYDNKPITFETFALQCSRAFGATIAQRDEPFREPPKLQSANVGYHNAQIAEAVKNLEEAVSLTDEEADRLAGERYAEACTSEAEQNERSKARRERYEGMLAQVRAWSPPTNDHVELKEFMIDQLTESIRFDCYEAIKPVKMTGEEYRNLLIESATRSINYHTEERQRQIEKTNERNKWITDLYNSLENS